MASQRLVLNAKSIKRYRRDAGLTQAQLAKLVGVSTSQISQWENGKGVLSKQEKHNLRDALSRRLTPPVPQDKTVPTKPAPRTNSTQATPVGRWLNEARVRDGRSIEALAHASKTSVTTVESIESGRTRFPREATLERLANALGILPPAQLQRQREERETLTGIGVFEDFDPHSMDDVPISAGVYVFYDRNDHPIYVGQTRNLRRRVKQHEEKFWFKKPLIDSASFIPIKDNTLRESVEEALIYLLRSSAVINEKGTNH